MPSPVLGEIGYLLQSRVGPQAEVTFLKSFGDDGFHIEELEDQDIQRMAELVQTYADRLALSILPSEALGRPVWLSPPLAAGRMVTRQAGEARAAGGPLASGIQRRP